MRDRHREREKEREREREKERERERGGGGGEGDKDVINIIDAYTDISEAESPNHGISPSDGVVESHNPTSWLDRSLIPCVTTEVELKFKIELTPLLEMSSFRPLFCTLDCISKRQLPTEVKYIQECKIISKSRLLS